MTSIAPQNHTARGWVKGQPIKFLPGHRITIPLTPEQVKARNREKALKHYHAMSAEKMAAHRARRHAYVRTEEYREMSRMYQRKRLSDPTLRESKRAKDRRYVPSLSAEKLAKHRETNRKAVKRWFAENPAKVAEFNNNRRSRVRTAEGSFTAAEWESLVERYNHRCAACDKQEPEIKLTVDHIIPVTKGGSNYIANIKPLCGSCNSKKAAKLEFMTEARVA